MDFRFFDTTIDAAGEIDVGKQKSINDDRCAVNNKDHIFVVADGVSMTHGGSKASSVAVDTATKTLVGLKDKEGPLEQKVTVAINEAHREVIASNIKAYYYYKSEGTAVSAEHFPSTTLVVGAVADGILNIGHVGDSRVYRITKGGVKQLTDDHTMYNVMKKNGMHPDDIDPSTEHVLSRFIGSLPQDFDRRELADFKVEVDTTKVIIRDEESYLLCTDGLNKHVTDEKIGEIVRLSKNPQDACSDLISAANAGPDGGSDNIGVVVIDAKRKMTPFGKVVSAATSFVVAAGIIAGAVFSDGQLGAKTPTMTQVIEQPEVILADAAPIDTPSDELSDAIPLAPINNSPIDCEDADNYSFRSRVGNAVTGDGTVVNQEVINHFYREAGWDGKGRGEDIPKRIGKKAYRLARDAGIDINDLVGENGSLRGDVFAQCGSGQMGSVEEEQPARKASFDGLDSFDDLPDLTEYATLIDGHDDIPDATEYATLIDDREDIESDSLESFLSKHDPLEAVEKAVYGNLPIRYTITERMNYVEKNIEGLAIPETYDETQDMIERLDDVASKLEKKKDSNSFKRAYARQDITSDDVRRVAGKVSELEQDLAGYAHDWRQVQIAESRDMALAHLGDQHAEEIQSDYFSASWQLLAENGFNR